MRTTFAQFRLSRAPNVLASCASDGPRLASFLNEATQRLIAAGGETGWWGTWMKVVFAVNPSSPYITLPRSIARLIDVSVCKDAVKIQNEFYEFLWAGVGQQSTNTCNCSTSCNGLQLYERGTYPTFADLTATGNPKTLRLYPTDARDYGVKRVLLQGLDSNGNVFRSLNNGVDIPGQYVTLATPFVDLPFTVSRLDGIQKDITVGDVLLYEVDSVTGAQVLLSRYEASETNPAYRRYFINGMPQNCCDGLPTAQVTGMAKLEFVPVQVDQDWLLISNIPALKLECEAIRYEEMDNDKAQAMAEKKHKKALSLLREELTHYLGKQMPAVNFAPFGTARLELVGIGMI